MIRSPGSIIRFPVLLVACASAAICACCRLPAGDEWTVMSWNVQNLFDGADDGTEYREFDPSGGEWDNRLYRRRLDRTAEVVRETVPGGADLLVFQELEKAEVLDDLADGPLHGWGYRWRVAVPGFSIIRCGILSRYPIRNVRAVDCGSWGERPLRPALAFIVDSPGGPVQVVAVHWKSPRNGRGATEATRALEAAEALSLATDGNAWKDIPAMILGDLNTPGDGMYRPAALAPWEPDADASSAVILRSPVPEEAGLRNGRFVFFDPEPDPQAGPPGTYWFDDDWDRPDRALLSPLFIDGLNLEFVRCRAGGVAGMEDFLGRPTRWRTDLEEGYSDHLPLVLEFRTVALMDTP